MSRWWLAIFIVFAAGCAGASDSRRLSRETTALCSDAWYRSIEENVPTGDGRGHGPDVGSDEWKSVIEFKLGIRDRAELPGRGSEAWCRLIDRLVRESHPSSQEGTGPQP